jgi:hypothetical protein
VTTRNETSTLADMPLVPQPGDRGDTFFSRVVGSVAGAMFRALSNKAIASSSRRGVEGSDGHGGRVVF